MYDSIFANLFLTASHADQETYRREMGAALDTAIDGVGKLDKSYSGRSAENCAQAVAEMELCPQQGKPLTEVLTWVQQEILAHSVIVAHPACLAHLQCPPLISALAAEVLISATNQSMDSWDQAPSATYLEQRLVDWLVQLLGFPIEGDGIFTSGGTQSNFMGLLLARESAGRRLGVQIQKQGLEGQCRKFRILCSEAAHFSVRQSAALLGLGEQAVVAVATDSNYRMLPSALRETIEQLETQGFLPIAVVATAGATDFGAIDPLDEIAAICQQKQLWLHVDAAYGGALLLSEQHANRLNGIALANSVTVDFHKLFYQPISCGAFLVRDREYFDLIHLRADYLNPEENEFNGILDLVSKSIQTTRRFDGLKLFMSMQVLGQSTFEQMIDSTLALTKSVAQFISADTDLEIANPNPALTTVVFRYLPQGAAAEFIDAVNRDIRAEIMAEGLAVIAQTRLAGRIYLKLTLLNPLTNLTHVQTIVAAVKRIGASLSNRYA